LIAFLKRMDINAAIVRLASPDKTRSRINRLFMLFMKAMAELISV
jgi:hypothetical protein